MMRFCWIGCIHGVCRWHQWKSRYVQTAGSPSVNKQQRVMPLTGRARIFNAGKANHETPGSTLGHEVQYRVWEIYISVRAIPWAWWFSTWSESMCISYLIHENVCYLTLSDRSFPKRLAFLYLEEIQKGFIEELERDHQGRYTHIFWRGWMHKIALVGEIPLQQQPDRMLL